MRSRGRSALRSPWDRYLPSAARWQHSAFAAISLIRLARPGGENRTNALVIAAPFAAIVLLAAINLLLAPSSHWDKMIVGNDWLECILSITINEILPLAVTMWAV